MADNESALPLNERMGVGCHLIDAYRKYNGIKKEIDSSEDYRDADCFCKAL